MLAAKPIPALTLDRAYAGTLLLPRCTRGLNSLAWGRGLFARGEAITPSLGINQFIITAKMKLVLEIISEQLVSLLIYS